MKCHNAIRFSALAACIVLFAFGGPTILADTNPANSSGKPRPSAESLEQWEWYLEFNLPEKGAAGYFDLLVPPTVFGRSQPNLDDIRIRDAHDSEVPFALRIRRPINEQQRLSATEYDRSNSKPGEPAQIKLDLGADPPKYNSVDVLTSGTNFRRRVTVKASDGGEEWATLVEKVELLSFHEGNQSIDVHRVHFNSSGRRRVWITVFPDPGIDKDAPAITSASVLHAVQQPGLEVTLPAVLGNRANVRADSRVCTAWNISFGGQTVPCERLSFEVPDEFVSRSYRLEFVRPDQISEVLVQGVWERTGRGARRTTETIEFREVMASQMRLVVFDDRNPPLNIRRVEYSDPARQIIIAASPELAPPLRLYFGNPRAQSPNYDFANSVPGTNELSAARIQFAADQPIANPSYHPAPKPWTERWPWLIYVVLGAGSLALVAILAILGRQAIARYDGHLAAR
jgi:hypothetical protein